MKATLLFPRPNTSVRSATHQPSRSRSGWGTNSANRAVQRPALASTKSCRCFAPLTLPAAKAASSRLSRVSASTMDALAEDLLFAAARRRPQIARTTQATLLRAERDVTIAEQRVVRYRDNDRLLELLDQDQYLAGLGTRAEVVREATADLQHLRAASLGIDPLRLRGVQRRWPDMDLAARRQALAWIFDAIFLKPGHGHVEERIWIRERSEAPSGLLIRGRPKPPRPFVFPTARRRPRASSAASWRPGASAGTTPRSNADSRTSSTALTCSRPHSNSSEPASDASTTTSACAEAGHCGPPGSASPLISTTGYRLGPAPRCHPTTTQPGRPLTGPTTAGSRKLGDARIAHCCWEAPPAKLDIVIARCPLPAEAPSRLSRSVRLTYVQGWAPAQVGEHAPRHRHPRRSARRR
jgi:hypothetical protein